MKTVKLYAKSFVHNPDRGYASYINNKEQLRIKHQHDYFEIFLVSQGQAVHCVNEVREKITAGDLYFMRPADIHYYDQPSSKFRIINMIVSEATMKDFLEYVGDGFKEERIFTPLLPPRIHLGMNELGEQLSDFEKLVMSKKVMREKSDTFFRIVLFNILLKLFPVEPIAETRNIPDWLQWLMLEIQKNENFKQGVSALYSLSGRSEAHVSRMCKKYLHKTPTQLINEIRIDYAVKLLIGTDLSATEVSERVGFESVSHFFHLFKNVYGMPPNTFRKDAERQHLDIGDNIQDDIDSRSIQEGLPLVPIIRESEN